MTGVEHQAQTGDMKGGSPVALGTLGRLAIFVWTLAMIMLMPADAFVVASLLALVLNAAYYPRAFKRILRLRWLLLAILIVLPNLLWFGEADSELLGLPVSQPGLRIGLEMVLRMLIILVAVDGFSSAVDISEVAGLFERIGLPGLGFSVGVAVNLLPSLRRSSFCTWHAMRLRGGFRSQRWRSLRFLLISIVANALRRAEEIALAAEVRAFSPGRSRPLPIKFGRYDGSITVGLLLVWLGLMLGY